MFATICLTAWKVPSLAPNCSRSLTWATVISSTASAPPMSSAHSSAASWRRSCSSRGQAAPARPHTRRLRRHDHDRRAPPVARRDQEGLRVRAVKHEALLAVEAEPPPAAGERRAQRRRLGLHLGLAHRERDDLLAARDRRKPRAPLRRRTEGRQREAARERREEPEGRRRTPPLLDQQPHVEERGPLAAVRRRKPVAEPAELRDRAPERRIVAGGRAVPFEPPLARDLGCEKPPRFLLHGLLLGGEAQVHRRLFPRQPEAAIGPAAPRMSRPTLAKCALSSVT